MTENEKLKVVQVGVAGFGGYRRQLMRDTNHFNIVAAYDWNEDALKCCVQEESCEAAGSYEELIERDGIEAAIISTGAKFHAEQIIAAAERGLHVFVEKPLCSTLEEVRAIAEVQKRKGVVIGLGHNDHRHSAVSVTIKKLLDGGELGTIVAFEKTTCHNGGLVIKQPRWNALPVRRSCPSRTDVLFRTGEGGIVQDAIRCSHHTDC